jgi:hypothetical protein
VVVSERVPGGCVLAWIREQGDLFGVTLLPDGVIGGGRSYTSEEEHVGFPSTYDGSLLLAWGRKHWPVSDLATDLAPRSARGGDGLDRVVDEAA